MVPYNGYPYNFDDFGDPPPDPPPDLPPGPDDEEEG
jgi:hypothetical protein